LKLAQVGLGWKKEIKMEVQKLPEGIVLVALHKEPETSNELKTLNETASEKSDFDVIIDFSRVEILASPSISNLIILHKLLRERGHRLILCNLSVPTKCIFTVAGVDAFFDFADDKSTALEQLGVCLSASKCD
jgi:anti-anti-sigma regulatory factor